MTDTANIFCIQDRDRACADRIRRLFAAFERDSIGACIWKSRDRWNDGVTGRTDIDLLIGEGDFEKGTDSLNREGWFPVEAESWRRFPHVLDFVTFESGQCLHLHLHSRIVSGEKMVKSLRPPLNDLYLRNVDASYPPFVKAELEFILLIVRITLKISLLDIAGAIKRRSRFALYRYYVGEYEALRPSCDRVGVARLLGEPELCALPADVILAAYDDLASLGIPGRRAIRKAVAGWREAGPMGVFPGTLWRHFHRRWRGVGKVMAGGGFSIAVCGPDGSGKTTLVEALRKSIARQLRVRHVYMGGNLSRPGRLRGCIMWTLWLPYLALRKLAAILGWQSAVDQVEALYFGLDATLMRSEKRRRLASGRRVVARGEIVLFERFPLFHPYGDDTADTVHGGGGRQMGLDLLVLLDVEEGTAIARKPEDQPDLLKSKVASFRRFIADPGEIAGDVIVLDADAPVAANAAAVLDRIVARFVVEAKMARSDERNS